MYWQSPKKIWKSPWLLALFALPVCACAGGFVGPIEQNTAPRVTLSGVAFDPAARPVTATVESDVMDLPERADDEVRFVLAGSVVSIFARSTDLEGLSSLQLWEIGAQLVDRENGEKLSGGASVLETAASFVAPAGREVAVFATSSNAAFFPKTTNTPRLRFLSSGAQPSLPPAAESTTIRFTWDENQGAYVAPAVPRPDQNAFILGVSIGDVFDGQRFLSLYRGDQSLDELDSRGDFLRMFEESRTEFFRGPWLEQPWYALKGLRVGADDKNNLFFDITLHWMVFDVF
ncbi:MAG: hypothetical protein AAF657_38240 [Acidobacteriota bacterium]